MRELCDGRSISSLVPSAARSDILYRLCYALPIQSELTLHCPLRIQEYHKRASQYIKAPIPAMKKKLEEFLELCTYISGQYDEDESFQGLEKELARIEESYEDKNSGRNRVFYMALPPSVFTTVAKHLRQNNYSEGSINRIIVEKPFGKDLDSSREMQTALKEQWKEDEVRDCTCNSLGLNAFS